MTNDNTPPSIMIATPSGDTVMADFAFSLAGLVVETSRACRVALCNPRSALVQKGRYSAVEQAKEVKADYIFFLDSDMVVPRVTILGLLARQKDIIGATYSRRRPPIEPITSLKDLKDEQGVAVVNELPTGCLLIKMSVFDALKPPYFNVEFTDGEWLGEDQTFCRAARAAGYSIHCDIDLSMEVGHVGTWMHMIDLEN